MLLLLCALSVLSAVPEAPAAEGSFALSKRVNRRYQDVIITQDGSRWRGRVIERGDAYRLRLEDQSEIVIPKEQVVSVTRELHPGLVHNSQWILRATPGFEVGFVIADEGGGPKYGPLLGLGIGHNFGGAFEPELSLVITPIGPDDGKVNAEVGLGLRYYLQSTTKAKAYTNTELMLFGTRDDLALRTGPGFVWDLSPGFGLGIQQGVTLLLQSNPDAVAVGYHAALTLQGRL